MRTQVSRSVNSARPLICAREQSSIKRLRNRSASIRTTGWAMDPRDFVTNAIVDRLRASGVFAHVESYDGSRDVDYVLSGRLEKLEELDYQGGVKVQVAISAEM